MSKSDVSEFKTALNKMFDPRQGLWSTSKLARKAKRDPVLGLYTNKHIKQTLDEHETFQRHKIKDIRDRKKKSAHVHAPSIGYFQIDIADFQSISPPNYKWNYLLLIIDIYSRFLTLFELETKEDTEFVPKIRQFIVNWNKTHADKYLTESDPKKSKNEPSSELITSDDGKQYTVRQMTMYEIHRSKTFSSDQEFPRSELFEDMCLEYRIKHYGAQPGDKWGKVSLVERSIRTIRMLLGRYITHTGSNDWQPVIHDLEYNYNHSKHRMIGTTPQWSVEHNDKFPPATKQDKLELKKWERDKKNYVKPGDTPLTIKVGDYVRVAEKRDAFHNKSHLPYWSKHVYVVHEQIGKRFTVASMINGKLIVKMRKKDDPELFPQYKLLKVHKPTNFDQQTDPTVVARNVDNENFDDSGAVIIPKNTDVWEKQKQINKERRELAPLVDDNSISDLIGTNDKLPRLRQGIRDTRDAIAQQHANIQKQNIARQEALHLQHKIERQRAMEHQARLTRAHAEGINVVPNEEDIDSGSDSSDSDDNSNINNKGKREIEDSVANQMNASLPQLLPSINSLQN